MYLPMNTHTRTHTIYLHVGTAAAGTDPCAKGHTQEPMQHMRLKQMHVQMDSRGDTQTHFKSRARTHTESQTRSFEATPARCMPNQFPTLLLSLPRTVSQGGGMTPCTTRCRTTRGQLPHSAKLPQRLQHNTLLAAARLLQKTMGVAHYG